MDENVIIVESTSTTVVSEQPVSSVILSNPVGLPGPTTFVGVVGGSAPDYIFGTDAILMGGNTP